MTTEINPIPLSDSKTEVGSYFISNYPPFSVWNDSALPEIEAAFEATPNRDIPLGLYIHIPFCRKRCRFCYFRVYTDQNAAAIEDYVQALVKEVELLSRKSAVIGRELLFVYFGGGTPSYLSARQLRSLRDRLHQSVSWDHAREVTFECEPGTLSLDKLKTLRDIGVTRLSLGVENFNDKILEENGRAHLSPEVFRAWDWIREVGFAQVNIDLIAGMIGETDENWSACIDKVLELAPDNITIYQMELPFNTLISKEIRQHGIESPIADWKTKRRWVNEAFDRCLTVGYQISSGNELVRNKEADRFVYRDNVWRGADLLGTGVASFGHLQGTHYQNLDQILDYQKALNEGRLPLSRAYTPTSHQRFIREFVLQMKEGEVHFEPFRKKFGVDPAFEFRIPLENQQTGGYLTWNSTGLTLTRKGLLQVDSLLPEYFEPAHREIRYT